MGLWFNNVILCLYAIHIWFVEHYIDIVINMHSAVWEGSMDNVIDFLFVSDAFGVAQFIQ